MHWAIHKLSIQFHIPELSSNHASPLFNKFWNQTPCQMAVVQRASCKNKVWKNLLKWSSAFGQVAQPDKLLTYYGCESFAKTNNRAQMAKHWLSLSNWIRAKFGMMPMSTNAPKRIKGNPPQTNITLRATGEGCSTLALKKHEKTLPGLTNLTPGTLAESISE